MNKEDNYLKESVIECVDFAMQQDDETKRRIFTGLFEYTDRLVNEDIMVKVLNDEEKRKWFDNEIFKVKDKEIERLNNIIKKAIHFINLNQDSKKLTLNYDDLKKLRGILNNDEYYLTLFEDQLNELKENK